MSRYLFFLVLLSLSSSLSAKPTEASIAARLEQLSLEQQNLYQQVSDELRCPTCTGLSVLQSDAPFSLEIRETVLEKVIEGNTPEQIRDFFTVRYGLWILRSPPVEGLHLLAWLIPSLAAFFGAIGVWFTFWRRRRTTGMERSRSRDELIELMHRELEERRK